jgi:hypothetical protein
VDNQQMSPAVIVPRVRKPLAILTGVIVSILVFYPGCMSGDAGFPWQEAVYHHDLKYSDWHSPFIAFIWHLSNALPAQPTP